MRWAIPTLLLTAGMGLTWFSLRADAGGDAAKPEKVKMLAQGAWAHLPAYAAGSVVREQRQWAIRSSDQLAGLAGPHAALTVAKAFKVKALDFNKQMILAVFDGTQPMVGVSGGGPPSAQPYRLAITGLATDAAGKVMTVQWRRVARSAKEPILSYPLAAVLVDRFDGEVRFQQLPPIDKGDEGKPPKVLARAFWPDGWPAEMPPQQWVVRSYKELVDPRIRAPEPVLEKMRQEAAARYAKALGVPAVDFAKQMVAGVSNGAQPAAARVEVIQIDRDPAGKALTVHWRLVNADAAAAELTHPAAVVLIEQFPGEVRFQQQRKP